MRVSATVAPGIDPGILFPFPLDEFQKRAIDALDQGQSVVVCAPTGSGKTLVGEYAIYRSLAHHQRVFYTTPLKALSNQKWRDFCEQFGPDVVGLLTGDTAINRDAPVVVMTTEIFRNMLYGTLIGDVGTSLDQVAVVVLDECHYMNDRQRGTVWEESVIYCPRDIQLLALSATVANSDQLTDWIHQVHGPTVLVNSDYRPVPLRFFFCTAQGFFPLLDGGRQRMNPKLRTAAKHRGEGKRRISQSDCPSLNFVISQLRQRDMLPAIYFIFSRRGCDQAIHQAHALHLVTPEEALILRQKVEKFLLQNPDTARPDQIAPLCAGIASHHAGLLPAWKAFVEELFQQGLVKVVFATETLAAGINMPARTTVISSLSKRTDRGHRLLNPSEFLQMAGRAGRRGMDDKGYVVTVQTAFEGAREAVYLGTSKADPLISQFTPSYGMVLNLLQTHTLLETKALIERSFGQYLATLYLRPQEQAIAQLRSERDQLQEQLDQVDAQDLASYEKLRQRLKEERRLLKLLHQQSEEVRRQDQAIAIIGADMGLMLLLQGAAVPEDGVVPAVLVTTVPGNGWPNLVCLSQDNLWLVVTVLDVETHYPELPCLREVEDLDLPPRLMLQPGQTYPGSEETRAIAQALQQRLGSPPPASSSLAPEVQEQLERIEQVREQLERHPLSAWGNPATLLKRQQRIAALDAEIQHQQGELGLEAQRHWEEFLALLEILHHFKGVEAEIPLPDNEADCRIQPTILGQIASAIRGDNELWLALALHSGHLDHLKPSYFATVCAALVTDITRADPQVDYPLAPEAEGALNNLWDLRRQLIKVQASYGVEALVLPAKWEDQKLVALVEYWAEGVTWADLCSHTSLDEGDVVRILRRTLDFLSQIPHIPHLSRELYSCALQAKAQIDRFPVNLLEATWIPPDVEPEAEEIAKAQALLPPLALAKPVTDLGTNPSPGPQDGEDGGGDRPQEEDSSDPQPEIFPWDPPTF